VPTHRINILGASGSGASTIGRALAAALSVLHFDSDDYYHEATDPPFQNQRTPQERCRLITADLQRSASWILSGGIAGWDPYPQLDFTLMVFVWVPTPIRIERLRRRERERFGQRVLPPGDMHASHEAFIEWAARYDTGDVEGKTLPRHEAYLATQSCPVLQFREVLSASEITAAILNSLGNRRQ
jgi:adenylate kinase family enzyme